MNVIEIIQKKRDKQPLKKAEIEYLINHYVDGAIPDYQMAAFLMAVCINGMTDDELSSLTDTMLYSGEVISHSSKVPLVDKHSTGGVGDKISIPLAPAIAACGLAVPMIAGRGLGHTGGTLDKLEAIPGFRCDISSKQYLEQVQKIGCVIMGQTQEIAPADKKIYALRDVTGTVPSIPLISASIMSKKLAEGIDALVLDVKYGSGAFMQEIERAKTLAAAMVAIGARLGKKVTARLTNMDQPLGTYLGNGLEIVESIDILQGRGPEDSIDLTLELGAEMLLAGNRANSLEEGRAAVKSVLNNGKAFEKFVEMVRAQGGDERVIHEPASLFGDTQKIPVTAKEHGFIERLDCRLFGLAIGSLGGGRMSLTDSIDPAVGITLHARIGDEVEPGQPICTIHAGKKGLDEAINKIQSAVSIAPHKIAPKELFLDRITSH